MILTTLLFFPRLGQVVNTTREFHKDIQVYIFIREGDNTFSETKLQQYVNVAKRLNVGCPTLLRHYCVFIMDGTN